MFISVIQYVLRQGCDFIQYCGSSCCKIGSLGHPLMGSRALSVESAEEGAELAEEGAVGGVNLSDFCRYYQQPTNNTPELALRIGSRLQELPQLLLLQLCCQYFANAMRSDEDSLRSLVSNSDNVHTID